MRKPLTAMLTFVTLAFLATYAGAKDYRVALTKDQVSTVCNGRDYCEVSCGLNNEHTCSFGCGSAGCSGACVHCASRSTGVRSIRGVVKTAGASLR
jgi:hypothetical protein